ncbi:MAG: FAD-dependent monooxygenase [Gammaproteobacteria bacterium]
MFDALISGSGVNGAVLALLLDQSGFRVRIVDHQPIQLNDSPRTITLNLHSLKLLEKIGIKIPSTPIFQIKVCDAVGSGKITFDAATIGESELARTVYFSDLLESLEEKTKTFLSNSVSVRAQTNPECISLELNDGTCIDASLLIASDTKLKPFQQLFDLSIPKNYLQQAATFIANADNLDFSTAIQLFYHKDIFALMPIHDRANTQDNNFSTVWSLDASESNLKDYAQEHLPKIENILGTKLSINSNIESFPLRNFIAEKYFVDRACLIGDAAHIIHPMAGQGLNLGLADCNTLHSEIAKAREEGIDIGSTRVLKRYEIKRKIFNDSMVNGVDRIHALFQSDNIYLRMLRNNGLNLINNVDPLKKFFIKNAEGIFGI